MGLFDLVIDTVRLPFAIVEDTVLDVVNGEPLSGENTKETVSDIIKDLFG